MVALRFVNLIIKYCLIGCVLLICSRHWIPGRTELEAGVRGVTLDDVSDDTKLIMSQLHRRDGPTEEPVVQPIVQSTIYRIKSVDCYRTLSDEVSRPIKESHYANVRRMEPLSHVRSSKQTRSCCDDKSHW